MGSFSTVIEYNVGLTSSVTSAAIYNYDFPIVITVVAE